MLEEILRVAYFPSTSLMQILENLKETSDVIEVDAARSLYTNKKSRLRRVINKDLPFIKSLETHFKIIEMSFRGKFRALVKHEYGTFPEERIRKFIKDEKIGGDLQVSKLVILCERKDLWDLLKDRGKTLSLAPKEQSIILTFKSNPAAAKLDYIRRRVYELMRDVVENLKFHPETLDLIRIETYPDWKYQVKNNLFGINWEKRQLREIMQDIFKEHIAVRSYTMGKRKTWELIEDEKL